MLRYHMAVLTRDTALKRAVRRLTTSTGSTADFAAEPAALQGDTPVNLYVLDVRGQEPDRAWLASRPQEAKFIYIIDGDSVTERVSLLEDVRATSLFALDDRFDDGEFIASATKALRGDVFGLQKYFPWGVTTLSMVVKNYQEKTRAIDVLTEYAALAGCRGGVRDRIQVVGDELMANALYHAPVDAQGHERYAGKTPKDLAQLEAMDPIQVQYGCSGRYFGIGVRDGAGSLARKRLLQYIKRTKDGAQIEDKPSGAGLGLVSIMKSVSKLVFNSEPGRSTEVVALFDMELAAESKVGARSLHIFMASPQPERRDALPGRRLADTASPASGGTNGGRMWWVAVAAAALLSSAGTKYYLDREAGAHATTNQTVVVFTDPEDANITLDGEVISQGQPVPLSSESPTLLVEKDGFQTKSLQFVRGDVRRHQLKITLQRN